MTGTTRDARYPSRLLSIREAIDLLGVSRPTIYRLIADGKLATVGLRGRTLIRPADIDLLIERSRQRRGG